MTITAAELRSAFQREGITKSFTIAFSPRCGSTLLSHILWSAGAGKPTEYFQYPYDKNENFSTMPEDRWFDVFRSLVRDQSAGNIFSSKMAHDHRARLDGFLSRYVSDYDGLRSVFPLHRWIFVKRKDLIRQAISWAIAEETGTWHLKQDQHASSDIAARYDYFAIFSKLQALLADNFNWDLYFTTHKFQPLTIFYEDFIADKASALKTIAAHIGFEADRLLQVLPDAERDLLKISDCYSDLYERTRERFIDNFLRVGEEDLLGSDLERWKVFFSERLWRADSQPVPQNEEHVDPAKQLAVSAVSAALVAVH